AGDTSDKLYKGEIMSFIKCNDLKDNVRLLGQRDDINDLMAKSTALIVPSIFEGFGRTTAEAIFNGCFVIGKNSGGTREIVEKINYGLLYDDEEELIEAMEAIVIKGIESYFPLLYEAQKKV